jgi:hypothetical protein
VALVARDLSSSGLRGALEHRVYSSTDGLDWRERAVLDFQSKSVALLDLLCIQERCIAVGHDIFGGEGLLVSSDDLRDWRRLSVGVPFATRIRRANGRYFVLGARLSWSEDLQRWTDAGTMEASLNDIAFGSGAYVAVGNRRFLYSMDGHGWKPVTLSCVQTGCISVPDGSAVAEPTSRVLFAEGRFYADRLMSANGLDWDTNSGPAPTDFRNGMFLRLEEDAVTAWTSAGSEVLQTALVAGAESCATARCLVSDGQLIVIP